MITVGEIRKATQGMSDDAEMGLEVVPAVGSRKGWRLELSFREGVADTFLDRHPQLPPHPPGRPEEYNAHALIPGLPPSVIDPRD